MYTLLNIHSFLGHTKGSGGRPGIIPRKPMKETHLKIIIGRFLYNFHISNELTSF
jgi:hypothetical protein